jgi:hypothetical protein
MNANYMPVFAQSKSREDMGEQSEKFLDSWKKKINWGIFPYLLHNFDIPQE